MRDYTYIDIYLDELKQDIYEQPPDEWHTKMATEVINKWIPQLEGCKTVLDVGCGQGFCASIFEKLNISYFGVTFGKDFDVMLTDKSCIFNEDFTFFPGKDNSFDLVFSRHSLEHSPMPLLTLMEWHRISKKWLCLITPNPAHFGFGGQNHYFVLTLNQLQFILVRSGWKIMWADVTNGIEYRFMCEKRNRLAYPEITFLKYDKEYINYDKVDFLV
jgi:SAM-dependent methyltransferase